MVAPSVTGIAAAPGRGATGTGRAVTQLTGSWRELRRRLGDRLAELGDGEVVSLGLEVVDTDTGQRPGVRLTGWGAGMVRAEVVAGADADAALRRGLLDLGWLDPAAEPGEEPDAAVLGVLDRPRARADELAALAVLALTEVLGCPDPAFLVTDLDLRGLRSEGGQEPTRTSPAPLATMPEGVEHLQEMVDEVLLELSEGEELERDEDGDVPVRVGLSTVFVRVLDDVPVVRLFGWLAVDLPDHAAALREVALLAARMPFLQLRAVEGEIEFGHDLHALPFAPMQLRVVLSRIMQEIDEAARDTVARLGGRRYLQPPKEPAPATRTAAFERLARPGPGAVDLAEATPLAAVVELMADARLAPELVAELFDHDRRLIVAHLVGVRAGHLDVTGVDVEELLAGLRAALRLVVWRQSREREPAPPRPVVARRRERQLSLLPDDEPGLELFDPGEEARWA